VKAAAHPSLLPTGRGGKIGTATAFFDEVGAPVAGGVLRQGGKEEGAQAQLYSEKKAAQGGGARGSAHRGVGHDGRGGRSSGGRVPPRGELMHKWVEGGEGWPAGEMGAVHGGLLRWGGGSFGPRRSECRGFIPRAVAVTGTTSGGQWDANGGRHCH
jgi:hypothetical protein